jgi:hypothetical protein
LTSCFSSIEVAWAIGIPAEQNQRRHSVIAVTHLVTHSTGQQGLAGINVVSQVADFIE